LPLLIPRSEGGCYYSIDLLAFCHFTGFPLEKVKLYPRKKIVKLGKLNIPVSSKGVLINFFATDVQEELSLKQKPYFVSFSLKDVLSMSDEELKQFFNKRLVLVGVTATAGMDVKVSPLGSQCVKEIRRIISADSNSIL